jgi:hypothetical protein
MSKASVHEDIGNKLPDAKILLRRKVQGEGLEHEHLHIGDKKADHKEYNTGHDQYRYCTYRLVHPASGFKFRRNIPPSGNLTVTMQYWQHLK